MQPPRSVRFGYQQHPRTGVWTYATTAPPLPWVFEQLGYGVGPEGREISITEDSMISDLEKGIPPPESWSELRSKAIAFREDQPFFDLVSAFQAGADGIMAGSAPGSELDPRREGPLIIAMPPSRVHSPAVPVLLLRTSWAMQLGIASRQRVLSALCGMLVNAAYEAVKDRHDGSPIFEYFRHVRNAASHGGTFNFREGEPSKRAEWRGLRIDHERKGRTNPLFDTPCFGSYLDIGDVLLLLRDIEQLLV